MPGNTFLKLRFALINNSVTLAGMHIFFLRIFVCVCVLLPVFLNWKQMETEMLSLTLHIFRNLSHLVLQLHSVSQEHIQGRIQERWERMLAGVKRSCWLMHCLHTYAHIKAPSSRKLTMKHCWMALLCNCMERQNREGKLQVAGLHQVVLCLPPACLCGCICVRYWTRGFGCWRDAAVGGIHYSNSVHEQRGIFESEWAKS